MLISQIVQLDAQSNEFARKHAAAEIGRPDGGESFADYLAATMNPETSRSEAGEIETSARDRTPERAHRADARAEVVADERVAREANSGGAEKARDEARDKAGRAKDTDPASREEKPKSEEAVAVAENDRTKKPTDADSGRAKKQPGAENNRELPMEAVSATDRTIDEIDSNSARSSEGGRKVGKDGTTGRVSSRRVSEAKVEIDVKIDLDESAAKASTSAKKPADASAASEDSEANDLRTRKALAERTRSESARSQSLPSESHDDRGEAGAAAGSKSEKAEKASDSDDRSTRDDRRVEVRDLRAERGNRRNSSDMRDGGEGRRGGGETAVGGDRSSETELRDPQSTTDRSSRFEALRAEGGPTSAASRASETSARTMNGTAANLRQTLQESLNAEIVRSARLVVRGEGRGEIRLNLKPDSLGTVRISLQMNDGHIAGRIIVDNQTVREVFEQNLASLQKAFEESGLEAGGVEISLADSGNQPDKKSTDEPSQRDGVRGAVDRFGYSVPDLSTIDEQHDLVDLVV